jgi:hypothetical protein
VTWRTVLAALATIGPSALVREVFHPLPAVEQVFVETVGNGVNITTITDQKDAAVLQQIFDAEARIIDALPDLQLSFDVILRLGRPLRELIAPKGTSLFSR